MKCQMLRRPRPEEPTTTAPVADTLSDGITSLAAAQRSRQHLGSLSMTVLIRMRRTEIGSVRLVNVGSTLNRVLHLRTRRT